MESSVLLTKAVFFSLLLHAFVLYMLALFFFKPQSQEEFPKIAVYLGASVTSDLNPGAPEERRDSPVLQENVVVNKKSVESKEIDISQGEELLSPVPPAVESLESEANESVVYELVIPSGLPAAPVLDEVVSGEGGDIGDTGDTEVSLSATSGSSLSEHSSVNVAWEGASAQVRFIPEPHFNLPLDGNLPDEVLVSFAVLADGSVSSVKVLPPASGSLNLDQQIRSYVRSFMFEMISEDDTPIKGLLRLSLTARESDDP